MPKVAADREAFLAVLDHVMASEHPGGVVLTLKEIGELVGLDKERIRQLETSAMRKLREAMRPRCKAA